MPIHNMEDDCGYLDETSNQVKCPGQKSCSSEELDSNGVFLLDTGLRLFLWVGRHAPREILVEMFGLSFDEIGSVLPALEAPLNQKVNTIVRHLQSQCGYWRPLEVMKQRFPGEAKVYAQLIEDKSSPGYSMSYVEFLCHVHSQIQAKMR